LTSCLVRSSGQTCWWDLVNMSDASCRIEHPHQELLIISAGFRGSDTVNLPDLPSVDSLTTNPQWPTPLPHFPLRLSASPGMLDSAVCLRPLRSQCAPPSMSTCPLVVPAAVNDPQWDLLCAHHCIGLGGLSSRCPMDVVLGHAAPPDSLHGG